MPPDPHFMDASGDTNIRINMPDILGSFDFESPEDRYVDDPFQPTDETEELHGGSYDPDSSYAWYRQSHPFENIADGIASDDEIDDIPAGSTCEEASQDDDPDQGSEELFNDIECPHLPRLTNDTGTVFSLIEGLN